MPCSIRRWRSSSTEPPTSGAFDVPGLELPGFEVPGFEVPGFDATSFEAALAASSCADRCFFRRNQPMRGVLRRRAGAAHTFLGAQGMAGRARKRGCL